MKTTSVKAREIGELKAFIKSLTLKKREKFRELRMKVWWWRSGEIRHAFKNPHEPTRFDFSFNEPAEEIARNYELMRRAENGGTFVENYLNMRRDERTVAFVIWGAPFQPPYRQIFSPNPKPIILGWTDSPHRIEWNLFLDDLTLTEAFLEYINLHCTAQKVLPQHRLKGKKFSGVSWRTIEILDCLKFGIISTGQANASQRSAASKGRKQAEKLYDSYVEATSAYYDNPYTNDFDGYTQF